MSAIEQGTASAPRVIAQLVITGGKAFGKATFAAMQQAGKNFTHKPEGMADSAPRSADGKKNALTSQLQMSLDEARLILNVKKDDPLDVIQKHYDVIFKANSPPPPPTAAETKPGAKPTPPPRATGKSAKSKAPTHSFYLQSKVFRALERIKAEKEAEVAKSRPEGEAAAEAGAEQPKGEQKEGESR
ncbi:hypothetical protein I350_04597 [Cryptococcus amylolentus CBS 6273]|uniref:Mitochondrial import inner membrane translocase subunit TIM16 n=1 Tax=Cryptococcus amylolentus CBS 6273 TaxID=1296118 RepID=A0A1E3JXQ7_9TREE|nr:hypothetical protein I350_04597 [Cryptococcus amylolentus CBS 6273]